MVNQEALRHAEKCRFCFMCRHLCPVQLQTGREINTPRAKGLLLSMVSKGAAQFDRDMAQTMYECMLCDACVNDCATGYQPPLFIRQARTEAVVNGLAPARVEQLLENIEKTGNIYGEKKRSFAAKGGDVLVFVGETAACRVPQMAESLIALLEKAGVGVRTLEDEPASGGMLADLAGYVEDAAQQAKTCADAINAAGCKTVVVLDSYDAELMKQQYPQWGCAIDAELVTATEFTARLIREGKIKAKAQRGVLAACHDDDRLARSLHEFDPIREMAKAAGFTLTEMFNHGKLAKSCGSAVALAYMPEITARVAAGRWDDLKRTESRVMLTASPQAYLCLQTATPEGYELVDLFTELAK